MKRGKLVFVLICLMLICACGCAKSYDGPPQSDTPEPEPLSGVFSGHHGTLIFNGDGKTVNAEFSGELSEAIGIPQQPADYEYSFSWDNFGPCRWDVATRLYLYDKRTDSTFDFSINGSAEPITRERIKLTYYMTDGFDGMVFELQDE